MSIRCNASALECTEGLSSSLPILHMPKLPHNHVHRPHLNAQPRLMHHLHHIGIRAQILRRYTERHTLGQIMQYIALLRASLDMAIVLHQLLNLHSTSPSAANPNAQIPERNRDPRCCNPLWVDATRRAGDCPGEIW